MVFACSALLLAAIGIYGLMAYSVAQRGQEIGIRRALGAQSSHIRNMVVRQGLRMALLGVVCGATIFLDEQDGPRRFLGEQRLPLTRLWLAKLSVRLAAQLRP